MYTYIIYDIWYKVLVLVWYEFLCLLNIWKPPAVGHASLEVLLSRLEKELFSDGTNESTQSNLSAEEWKAL